MLKNLDDSVEAAALKIHQSSPDYQARKIRFHVFTF